MHREESIGTLTKRHKDSSAATSQVGECSGDSSDNNSDSSGDGSGNHQCNLPCFLTDASGWFHVSKHLQNRL